MADDVDGSGKGNLLARMRSKLKQAFGRNRGQNSRPAISHPQMNEGTLRTDFGGSPRIRLPSDLNKDLPLVPGGLAAWEAEALEDTGRSGRPPSSATLRPSIDNLRTNGSRSSIGSSRTATSDPFSSDTSRSTTLTRPDDTDILPAKAYDPGETFRKPTRDPAAVVAAGLASKESSSPNELRISIGSLEAPQLDVTLHGSELFPKTGFPGSVFGDQHYKPTNFPIPMNGENVPSPTDHRVAPPISDKAPQLDVTLHGSELFPKKGFDAAFDTLRDVTTRSTLKQARNDRLDSRDGERNQKSPLGR